MVSRRASVCDAISETATVPFVPSPTSALTMNSIPSCRSNSTLRLTTSFLSSFILGIPYIRRPPMRSSLSYTVIWWPAELSCAAAARPAGPDPTMATCFCVLELGGLGLTQPSRNPRSIIAISMFLIVTAGELIPKTHDPSQGAGQTRPVNSGKLLVLWRR